MKRYVDFDGTLAEETGWKGFKHLGKPILEMVLKVKKWLQDGDEVVLHTARLTQGESPFNPADEGLDRNGIVALLEEWCVTNIGQKLPIINEKHGYGLSYDDWGRHVIRNTGMTASEYLLSQINIDKKLAKLDNESYTLSVLMNLESLVKQLENK
jgi:hypothetical protein